MRWREGNGNQYQTLAGDYVHTTTWSTAVSTAAGIQLSYDLWTNPRSCTTQSSIITVPLIKLHNAYSLAYYSWMKRNVNCCLGFSIFWINSLDQILSIGVFCQGWRKWTKPTEGSWMQKYLRNVPAKQILYGKKKQSPKKNQKPLIKWDAWSWLWSFTVSPSMRQFRVSNLRTNAFGKSKPLTLPPPKKNIPTILPLHVETNNQKYIIAPGKKSKNILCSIQTSLTQQLKAKVHPEKQSGWCQGRRSWVRDQGGTGLERTQLGPRWASETLGHLLPKRCLQGGNPLQKPQEIREKNSMQSKTSLFIEIILLHWQSWRAVMQKQALGERSFFPDSPTPQKEIERKRELMQAGKKEKTKHNPFTEQNRIEHTANLRICKAARSHLFPT